MGVGSAVVDVASRSERRPLHWGRLIQIACAGFALLVAASDILILLFILHAAPGVGDIGRERTLTGLGSSPKPGHVFLNTVLPGSPLDRAGVKTGDLVAFDRPYDGMRYPHAGELIGLTLDRDGRSVHLDVAAAPVFGAPFAHQQVDQEVVSNISMLVPALLGVFVVLRSRGKISTVLFGMLLAVFGGNPALVSLLPVSLFAAGYLTYYVLVAFAYASIIAFGMTWGRPQEHRLSMVDWAVLGTSLALILPMTVSGGLRILTYQPRYTALAIGAPGLFITVGLVIVFCIYLAIGRAASPPQERSRQNMLLAGLGLYVLALVFWRVPATVDESLHLSSRATNYIYALTAGIAAPVLLTYAVLKHRVIDLGFVVNRTLVYGVASAILLAAFALTEWAVDRFVPIEGRGKNVLFDAVLAVCVYLAYHRVERFVERTIQSLFFRRWQDAEANLRRFVRAAPFIEKTETLTRSFVEAVTAFADGATAGLYFRSGEGAYQCADVGADTLPAEIDPDDSTLIALRADPQPLEPSEIGSSVDAAVIAPIVIRNTLTGVLVLGPKLSGQAYRPDEIELIGWATRQVGHDLHALRVEGLERTATVQKRRMAQIQARNHELRLALAQRRTEPAGLAPGH
jgi:hypothetical protein